MVLARTPMEVGIQYVRMAIARDYSPGGRATLYINKGVDDHWQLFLVWKQTSSPEDSRPRKFLRERLPELATDCSSEPDAEARILTVLLFYAIASVSGYSGGFVISAYVALENL